MNNWFKRIGFLFIVACFVWTTAACSMTSDTTKKEQKGPYQIGMLPKFTSDPYFKAVNEGAQTAAKELGVNLDFNGPVNADVSQQADIINRWTQKQYDAITVSANDQDALIPALQDAKKKGIKTSTFDADVKKDGRDVFLMPVTFEDMGKTMVDMMAKQTGGKGNFLVVTAVLTAPNQNAWIEEMKKYMKEKYPDMKIAAILPGNEDLAQSRNVALNYLRSHPDTAGVFCVTGIATPGVAEAVEQLGLKGKVVVTGLGVPNLVRKYIKSGTIKEVCLWDPKNLGYATIQLVKAQLDGKLDSKSGYFQAGKLGKLKFVDDSILLLGPPTVFNKDNIDQFNF
ncbi:monosaccharide ABC transporter substrate-binding protein, CUT2 family [Seinonella peptonophila]|uniref:Autoinducer 2-binding protein LsrB n=1 Tax=Seinonella peptonophila TaxID=112248 RepID=A0A1M4Y7B9_9BACL|nr:substrate-binding domain-containing protein [Seinonella peptonophila]SHF01661.1 monosaccharide ABC transporter substrate-binding protein, CUT2 family [Seinonella peptonophila]